VALRPGESARECERGARLSAAPPEKGCTASRKRASAQPVLLDDPWSSSVRIGDRLETPETSGDGRLSDVFAMV